MGKVTERIEEGWEIFAEYLNLKWNIPIARFYSEMEASHARCEQERNDWDLTAEGVRSRYPDVSGAFSWAASPSGHEFWLKISRDWGHLSESEKRNKYAKIGRISESTGKRRVKRI
jgi:hypothetical protein